MLLVLHIKNLKIFLMNFLELFYKKNIFLIDLFFKF